MDMFNRKNTSEKVNINYTLPVTMMIWGELDAEEQNGVVDKFFNLLYSEVRIMTA